MRKKQCASFLGHPVCSYEAMWLVIAG